jgi:hypothetical protein
LVGIRQDPVLVGQLSRPIEPNMEIEPDYVLHKKLLLGQIIASGTYTPTYTPACKFPKQIKPNMEIEPDCVLHKKLLLGQIITQGSTT